MSQPGTYVYEVLDSGGRVCCGGNLPDFPRCERCKTKVVNAHRSLRTAIPAHQYAPPDPYTKALEPLRAELAAGKPTIPAPVCPFDDKNYTGKPNSTPPNGIQIALDRLKQKGQNR